MNSSPGNMLSRWWPPLGLLLVVLAVWQASVWWFDWPPFLMPAPSDVARAVADDGDRLLAASLRTGVTALAGFTASLVAGVLIAVVFSQSRLVRQFPIIASTTAGLVNIDEDLLELFRLYRADRWQVLWKLRLPHAVPYLVTGARTSSGMAVIGAIVGEFFVGHTTTHYGLGYLVLSTSQHLKTAHLFAAVIASALLGIALFTAVTWIGTTLLSRWGSGGRQAMHVTDPG